MTAPPLFRIFDFGKHQPRLDRIENALVQHAGNDRRRTADVQIEVAHAGFEFVRHAAHRRATARGESFHFDAMAFFELLLDLFFHLGARRKRYRDLTFLLRGINQLVPFRRTGGFVLLAICGRGEDQEPKQADRQKLSRDYDLDWQAYVSTKAAKIAYSAKPFAELLTNGLIILLIKTLYMSRRCTAQRSSIFCRRLFSLLAIPKILRILRREKVF